MEEKDCRSCKSYKDCNGKANYNYSEIRWCPYQCMWIIERAEALRTGDWGAIDDNIGSRNTPNEADFCKAINALAELEVRLKVTGADGEKLVKQVAQEGREFKYLSPKATAALMYIKGWRRKRTSYKDWLRKVFYKPKAIAKSGSEPVN